jgi:protease-4
MSLPTRTFCLMALLLVLLGATGCSLPSLLITPVSNSPDLEETIVEDGSRRHKIALIEVEGMLLNSRLGSGGILGAQENKVSLFKQQLDAAAADERVEAVVLRINSPGGTVAASDVMYELVRDFKEQTGKPVIAACQDVCASGGYYVASAADEIHALPTSVVGSIGVIFETIDLSPLMDKVGVRVAPVQSGPLKDMGSPFNGLSDDERAVMQGMVDEFYARFVTVVRASREVTSETAFDGRVMTGSQALEMNLVDEVCQLAETLDHTRRLIKERDARVIMYRRPFGYRGSIYARSADLAPRAEGEAGTDPAAWLGGLPIVSEVSQVMQPGFYYLWMP